MSQKESMSPARFIARVIARSGLYHRRNAITAGLVGLGASGAVLLTEDTAPKVVAVIMAVIFGAACYRSARRANLYFDPSASPVLMAIAETRDRLVSATFDPQQQSLVIADDRGNSLPLRIEGEGQGDANAIREALRELGAFCTAEADPEE